MKTELIESINLNDEYEKYFYSSNNKYGISRRDFIKFSVFSSAGIILTGTNVVQAEEGSIFTGIARIFAKRIIRHLLRAKISDFNVTSTDIDSNTPTSGEIFLANDARKRVSGDLKLTMVQEWDYKEFSSKKAGFSIPPNTIRKYGFNNGPSAVVNNDTQTRLISQTRLNKRRSQPIIIRA